MAAIALDLSIFPLKFVPGLADSKLSELGLEGYYRYDIVRGQSDIDGATTNCAALDDELRAQIFYRYPLGGRLPKIGAGVGLAQERTRFACNQTPALTPTFGSTEIQLKILQPIIGERLTLDVSGGPRILLCNALRCRTSLVVGGLGGGPHRSACLASSGRTVHVDAADELA